jgi:hypothetical protein
VVGLQRTGRKQRVCPLGLCLCNQEFQFAGLVPAKRQTGLVVAFHQQAGSAKEFG